MIFETPLAEIVTDFFDELKSRTKGYASMEFQLLDFRVNDLVKLEIKINQEPVDPLACIVHRDKAYGVGKALAGKLKQLIPKQQFRVPIQAAVGGKVAGFKDGSDGSDSSASKPLITASRAISLRWHASIKVRDP